MARFFEYGDEEVAYLKSRDPKLAQAIDAVGHVNREMMDEGDLFAAVVHHIIGDSQGIVVAITIAIICALFVAQRAGTSSIGRAFGPMSQPQLRRPVALSKVGVKRRS